MSLKNDERAALSFHIIVFFGTLVIAAVLYIFLEPMAMEILNIAGDRTSTTEASQGQQYIEWTFGSMHLIVIGLGLLQLLAAAVFEGRVRR